MTARINESKTLPKHIPCKCKCKFDGRKCNSNQNWSIDKCPCESKTPSKHHVGKINYIWNPSTYPCENSKYLDSIITGDSVITCDEIRGWPKLFQQKLFQQKVL